MSRGSKVTLELLLPIARRLDLHIEELVGVAGKLEPRVIRPAIDKDGVTILPLSGLDSATQVFHHTMPANDNRRPRLQSHDGYEWVYVLRGRLRLILGATELTLAPGEAAEFDTKTPHWFGNGGRGLTQYLTIFGRQGEKVHLRARPRT